jgi:uncharacterized membrane protein
MDNFSNNLRVRALALLAGNGAILAIIGQQIMENRATVNSAYSPVLVAALMGVSLSYMALCQVDDRSKHDRCAKGAIICFTAPILALAAVLLLK